MSDPDIYERHLANLMAIDNEEDFQAQVMSDWDFNEPLFRRAGPSEYTQDLNDQFVCGCLTQIRMNPSRYAATADGRTVHPITQQIVADERIPKSPDEIRRADLPIFLEWQHILNEELRSGKA